MLSTPSVAIVGAGVTGLSAAHHLVQRGFTDVTILEATSVASGSSGRSIGLIETQYLTPLDVALRAVSMEIFREQEAAHGLRIVRNGYLRLAHADADAAAFSTSIEIQQHHGITSSRLVSPEEIRAIVPDLRVDDIVAGLWGPTDGYIDGHLYAGMLADLATAAGAVLRTRSRVIGADRGSTRRHRLRTTTGEVECDIVVNAAGAWASEVGVLLGTDIQLTPQRHQVVSMHLSRPLDYTMPSVVDYSPGSGREGLYFRHETSEQLLVGLHSEETVGAVADPNNWHVGVDDAFIEKLCELIPTRLPAFSDAALGRGWAGLYPVSPDGLPQVGPCVEDETVIAACGVGGFGIQVAPVMGRLVAEWVSGERSDALAEHPGLRVGRASLTTSHSLGMATGGKAETKGSRLGL